PLLQCILPFSKSRSPEDPHPRPPHAQPPDPLSIFPPGAPAAKEQRRVMAGVGIPQSRTGLVEFGVEEGNKTRVNHRVGDLLIDAFDDAPNRIVIVSVAMGLRLAAQGGLTVGTHERRRHAIAANGSYT